ncbi:putative N-formylglutamate amidohydrolase [Sphingobium sp. SYK-6]|uniref:N-formylglutamate amidohydrolase n=1 Tax=Sphingobium sp. (strain NBRC 103272 / SYK-6) TaxID=627192 RepID=UPI0002277486|nr:N-formylglutamate amidohydrolase [Sphingobium sp. SYK-6]BAK67125.1 putative N-formylglutamate amidohydrolase [Sphingobium sp. SYK-6]
MTSPFHILGDSGAPILIVADHASNAVPEGIDLGVPPALMDEHVALDIGVAEVAALLVRRGGCCAILGGVSRLVIDYNREPDAAGLVPVHSDGHHVEGNGTADVADRLLRFYDPYHAQVERLAGQAHRPFILSLHSFTPGLRSRPEEARPWEIGILYNEDDRAARIAIPLLSAAGLVVGDQQPYSGKLLNASMNRHAEAHGRPYLGVEMRQDLVNDAAGQARFAEILGPVLEQCRKSLA